MSDIALNLENVEERIREACKRSGRDRSEIELIAVSKMNPASSVVQAINEGQRVFGENKVQELVDKSEELSKYKDIEWHMIGNLQSNKVRFLPGIVKMIHSVDRLKIAKTINKEAKKNDMILDVLCEVNVAEEDSKMGLMKSEVVDFVKKISTLENIRIRGLMTIAPYTDDAEDNRKYFRELRELKDKINSENIENVHMDKLSMGMTGDFEVAIEEGANYIRVGTGIFGKRDYTK